MILFYCSTHVVIATSFLVLVLYTRNNGFPIFRTKKMHTTVTTFLAIYYFSFFLYPSLCINVAIS